MDQSCAQDPQDTWAPTRGCSCWMLAPRKGTGASREGTSAPSPRAASASSHSNRPCTWLRPSNASSDAGRPSTPAAALGAFLCVAQVGFQGGKFRFVVVPPYLLQLLL